MRDTLKEIRRMHRQTQMRLSITITLIYKSHDLQLLNTLK